MPEHHEPSASERACMPRTLRLSPRAAVAAVMPAAICLTGCQAVEGIFKAGFWVGALAVIAVIALVIFVAMKALS